MREGTGGIIVTGGASGIGLATARALARTGVPVLVCDIDEPAEQLDGVSFFVGDVRCSSTIKAAKAEAGGQLGGLVACAAKGPLHHNPAEIVETNYHAQIDNVLLCRDAFVEWSSVVLLSSTAGFRFHFKQQWLPLVEEPFGSPRHADLWRDIAHMTSADAYALSKWAVNNAVSRLGRMLASSRVRVNCVAPGPTTSKMSESLWRDRPEEWAALVHGLPSQVANEPEDVAAVIQWLCTEAARGVFGSFLHVDGGWKLDYGE